MKNDLQSVINSYENYQEDFRLQSDNSHRLEYLTTIAYMDKYLEPGSSILDVAAGTGIYALRYAARGHAVTAFDITPKYIDIINKKAADSGLQIDSRVNDARSLSSVPDASVDNVFCMGPIYHLTEKADRDAAMRECVRVLKPGGLLFLAYINKYFIFSQFALSSRHYLTEKFYQKIIVEQKISSSDEDTFWTDSWFTTPDEIESIASDAGLTKVNHIAQDGIGRLKSEEVDMMSDENFKLWADFHIRTCEEPSILGISNHGLYIGKKS